MKITQTSVSTQKQAIVVAAIAGIFFFISSTAQGQMQMYQGEWPEDLYQYEPRTYEECVNGATGLGNGLKTSLDIAAVAGVAFGKTPGAVIAAIYGILRSDIRGGIDRNSRRIIEQRCEQLRPATPQVPESGLGRGTRPYPRPGSRSDPWPGTRPYPWPGPSWP